MDLIQLVVLLIVIGVLLWLVNVHMPDPAKQIVNVIVTLALVLWLLTLFGLLPLGRIRVGPP